MKITSDKKAFALSSVLAFLVMLFAFSFLTKTDFTKTKSVKSALLNPKYELSKITISHPKAGQLELLNLDDFWGAHFTLQDQTDLTFPADSSIVKDFINLSQTIQEFAIIIDAKEHISSSKIIQKYKTFGLNEEDAVCVTFYNSQNTAVSKLYFGFLNQTLDRIFVKNDKNITVYSIDSKIADYLDLDTSFWSDHNILPKSISKNLKSDSIQSMTFYDIDAGNKNAALTQKPASEKAYAKIVSLRYSKIVLGESVKQSADNATCVKVFDGKGTEYTYIFVPSVIGNENCYTYRLHIEPSIIYTDRQKEFISNLNGTYCISEWTFNSLKESLQ
ncbi:MAG: DUF4340 domain-containing protein [Treponema sp.]|uniref:DUF4340 domain-containing protein n=1 Tax=Treponema sp. TaxID=166 RepID=UPI00298EAFD2|nr:DUF4340 domain-containing protein [Treponema sp.]MBR5934450.1 DUF4340 domain-containing protein [Treponema sp.]